MLGKLAGQTAIYGISSVLARLVNFLLVPYLTRVMTTGEYGVIGDMYALMPFLLVVLTMGLESGYFRFAGKAATEGERRTVFATTWGAVIVAGLVFMGAVVLFRPQIADLMGYAERSSYIWLVGAIVMFDVITAIPFAKLRQEGRAGRFVMLRLLSVMITVALCVFFYSVSPRISSGGLFPVATDPGYFLVANLVASAAVLVALLPSCGGVMPRIDRAVLRRIMIYSAPLLISGIAGTANEFIDRQMIKYLAPAAESMDMLGVYTAVVKLGVVMTLFTQMYRMGAEPFFLGDFKKGDFQRANAAALKYYFIVATFIFLVIALYSDVFALILGRDFRDGVYILPLVLVANMLSGAVLTLSFWYKQLERTQVAIVITGIGLLFTVVFNVLLVPTLGYYGAAIARLVCEGVMVAASYLLGRRYYPIPYELGRIGLYLSAGAVLYGVGLACAGLPTGPRWALDAVLVAAFVVLAVRREKIDVGGVVRSALRRKG